MMAFTPTLRRLATLICAASLAALATPVAAPVAAATQRAFDAFDGVANPAGPFIFGTLTADGIEPLIPGGCVGDLRCLTNAAGTASITKNIGAAPVPSFFFAYPVGRLVASGDGAPIGVGYVHGGGAATVAVAATGLLNFSGVPVVASVYSFDQNGTTLIDQALFAGANVPGSYAFAFDYVGGPALFGLAFASADLDQPTPAVVAFDFDVTSAVPEPATWALLIVGFGLVGAAARRRGAALG